MTCNKCGETKPSAAFRYTNYLRKCDGKRARDAQCRDCRNKRYKETRKDIFISEIKEPFQELATQRHIAEKALIKGKTEKILNRQAEEAFAEMIQEYAGYKQKPLPAVDQEG